MRERLRMRGALPVRSFEPMTSASVYQSGSSLVR